jgi:superfamily II DNA or RNA helicase
MTNILKIEEIDYIGDVYNLHVENNHNYIANGVVVSNCHGSRAKILQSLLSEYGKNIAHRFGLTGTLPDHPVDLMLVKVVLGDVIFTSYAKDLIEAGWLATPNISIVQLNDVAYLQKSGVNEIEHLLYEEELHFLKSCITRQQWIANYIIEKSKSSKIGNTLILVNNIVYGKQLTKLIPNAVFLHGKDKDAIRQKVYDLFEVQDDLIVICTKQIAGVGLSIDRIFILIYIDGGKSFINTIQTIGRGLRKGRDKDSVDIIDICGNMVISNNHLKQRIKYYKGANYFYKKHTIEYYNGDINLC